MGNDDEALLRKGRAGGGGGGIDKYTFWGPRYIEDYTLLPSREASNNYPCHFTSPKIREK